MAKFGSDYQGLSHHYIHNVDYSECYGNRMFSENFKIYSYGRHYLMGLRGILKDGQNFIIINDNGSSVTTNKQTWALRGAVPSWWKVFNFNPEYHLNINKVFNKYFENMVNLMQKAEKARTRKMDYIEDAQRTLKELQEYFNTFKGNFDLRKIKKSQKTVLTASHITNIDIFGIVDMETKAAKAAKRKADKQRAIYQAKQQKIELKDVELWKNGELNRLYLRFTNDTFLRVNKEKKEVQTSQGLVFRLIECKLLYKCLKDGRCLKGSRITLNGSEWIIKEWNETYLIIGCHTIPVEEIERIATILNF